MLPIIIRDSDPHGEDCAMVAESTFVMTALIESVAMWIFGYAPENNASRGCRT
jgi:hypothetical protein